VTTRDVQFTAPSLGNLRGRDERLHQARKTPSMVFSCWSVQARTVDYNQGVYSEQMPTVSE